MIKKIAIIIILMLLITSFTSTAENIPEYNNIKENNKTYFNEDVPTWQINDYWTYDINKLDLKITQSGTQTNLSLIFTNFKLTVVSITNSTYNLNISGKVQGSFLYNDSSGLLLGGKFLFSKMSGSMQLRKSDLATISGELIIKSITLLNQNPLKIPLPIPLTIKVSIAHDSSRPFIDFPLYDQKLGTISEATPNIDIKVESIVLKILHIFIADIPSEIISHTGLLVPSIPYIATQESISVKAGTFNAYNIRLGLGLIGYLYYAPEVKNIVKLNIGIDLLYQYSMMFNAELINSNYH